MTKFIVRRMKNWRQFVFTISNCSLLLADTSHKLKLHVSVRLLTMKISQWTCEYFCSYCKIYVNLCSLRPTDQKWADNPEIQCLAREINTIGSNDSRQSRRMIIKTQRLHVHWNSSTRKYTATMKNNAVTAEKYLVKIPYSNDRVNTIHFIFLAVIKNLTWSKITFHSLQDTMY